MKGTLWKCESGILVCTEWGASGWMLLLHTDTTSTTLTHISRIHNYYTQLTQPQEEK